MKIIVLVSSMFHSRSKDKDLAYLSNFTKPQNGALLFGEYHTPEHAFQAMKIESYLTGRPGTETLIVELGKSLTDGGAFCKDPYQAKKMGGVSMSKLLSLRLCPKWEKDRVTVMREILEERYRVDGKFREIVRHQVQNKIPLRHFERSKDSFWGGHTDSKTKCWVGQNMLGQLIESLYNEKTI